MSAVPGGSGDSAVELELVAIEMRGDAMRRRYAAAALGVILVVGAKEYAQQPAAAAPEVGDPAYLDPNSCATPRGRSLVPKDVCSTGL
jgi:hypothetical protein